jgi:hypothetical protein
MAGKTARMALPTHLRTPTHIMSHVQYMSPYRRYIIRAQQSPPASRAVALSPPIEIARGGGLLPCARILENVGGAFAAPSPLAAVRRGTEVLKGPLIKDVRIR